MRISSAAALLLAACAPEAAVPAPVDEDDLIACAVGGAGTFTRDCVIERSRGDEGLLLVVRHPDGGFRRFVTTTGAVDDIAPADGAEPAALSPRLDGVEVAVGADRYRFPAAIAVDDER